MNIDNPLEHGPMTTVSATELIQCRETLGLTRAELASKLRLPAGGQRTVAAWENGSRDIPGVVTLALEYLLYLQVCGFPLPPGSPQAKPTDSASKSANTADAAQKEKA